MSSPASYPIESVENAARVLLMLRDKRVLRVAEVSADLGIARSSAHRMLTTLQAHGLLRQDSDSRGYRAGARLVELGIAVIGATDLRAEARPVLEELAKLTNETVHLVVLEDTQILFVDGVEGNHVIRAALRTGDRGPAHAAAAGKVLLASLSQDDLRARYPTSRLRGGTDCALATRRELIAELDRVREDGYATNYGESETSLHAISAPILDVTGSARAAISLSGPASRLTAADLLALSPVLVDAAARVSSRLS